MTETTMFLAKLMGPLYLIVAISMMMNRDWYQKLLKRLEADVCMYIGAILALVIGLAIVLTHNVWTSLPAVVVSLIGWLCIAKGAFHLLAPEKAIEMAKSLKDKLQLVSFVALIIGAYLSYVGYMI